jgi:hypothetical protein
MNKITSSPLNAGWALARHGIKSVKNNGRKNVVSSSNNGMDRTYRCSSGI